MIRLLSGLIVGLSTLILIAQSINAAEPDTQREATSQVMPDEEKSDDNQSISNSKSDDKATESQPTKNSVDEMKSSLIQSNIEAKKSEFPAEPSSDGYSFLGFSVFSGFVHQPQNQNILMSDNSVDIEARLAPSHVLNSAIIVAPATKENWELYMSSDGTNYKKVDSESTKSLLFTNHSYDKNLTYKKLGITKTGTYHFQFKVKTPIALGLGSYHTYYSQPFVINVVQDEIKAVGISIDQGTQGEMLKNDEKDFSATLNPTTSTDKITWSSTNEAIASIDTKTGVATAHKKGTTIITATAKNRSGQTDAYASYALTVTGGLDDVTVNEGEAAVFAIKGLQKDITYETTWYQQKGDDQAPNKDEVLKNDDNHAVNTHNMKIKNATMSLDGSRYYAKIQAFISVEDENGNIVESKPAGDPFFTDTATLTVKPMPPKLEAVGMFDFGTIKIKGNDTGKHYPKNQDIIIKNPGHKDWSLSARQKTQLQDSAGNIIPFYFNNQKMTTQYRQIATDKDSHVTNYPDTQVLTYQSNEGFSISMPEKIIAGTYRSEMDWQLADVPTK